ncbi:MAG: NAD(P)-dependent oxidoreductase [candidate division Zixibacteria bacterium]|nr:NAD(P)-dependent oxidoreductase [candidate division Zixibacteria bacterium]
MKTTILVTGSSGTVGTALTRELIKRKYNVIPLDIRHSYWDKEIDHKTLFHDLRKPLDKLRLRHHPDLIVHLAANARVHDLVIKPRLALDNYLMVHNVLEYARKKGIKRLLFSSSREVYGESKTNKKRKENSTCVTCIKAPYTASKFAAEALFHAYDECYGIRSVIARLSNVYGRYDVSERVIPVFLYYALRNREIKVFGREKKLDFTYIDDCIDGLMAIMQRFDKIAGETFNLSSGKGERLVDLAQMVIERIGSKSKIKVSSKRVGEISSFVGDITLARKQLGYNPKVSLKAGLADNTIWYINAMKERRVYESQRRNLFRRGWL